MLERNFERSSVNMVKWEGGRHIAALFKERAREPSGKDGVLPELVLQLRKTTETPKGEHPGFGVGA